MKKEIKNRKELLITEIGFDEYYSLKELPFESQRYNYHTGKIPSIINRAQIVEDDEKIYLVMRAYRIGIGKGHLYLKQINFQGVTYTKVGKATQRVKVWKSESCYSIPYLHKLLTYTGNEWWNEFDEFGKDLLTPGLLGMIIKGNISNPRDYCKYYIKNCLRMDVSAELLYQLLKPEVFKDRNGKIKENGQSCSINYKGKSILKTAFYHKAGLVKFLHICSNPNVFLQKLLRTKKLAECVNINLNDLNDMHTQALALGKKIDFSWSKTRMNAMHQEWSEIMTEKEMDHIANISYDYEGELELPKGWSLVTTEKKLFSEGRFMHHCIYGRRESLRSRKTFIIHAIVNGDHMTVSMNVSIINSTDEQGEKRWNDKVWCIGDIRRKYNKDVTSEEWKIVEECVMSRASQNFFRRNHRNKQKIENFDYDRGYGIPEGMEEELPF